MTEKNIDSTVQNDIHREIIEIIKSVNFGSVNVIIHNQKIVQIDTTEKRRYDLQNLRTS